ncbi:MAG TPA: sigma 54-interacting transcriptional regulator, partial [Candidatus Aminicenantes bacterium]|nr:sigma 54-interacting transcriptional regulator [Candidatus Aminicenantes bacterium]
MDTQNNLLFISDDFSLYDSVKRSPVGVDVSVFFAQLEDDYVDIVRDNGIRVVLVDPGDSLAEGLLALKKIKKADPLVDVLVGGPPLDREAALDVVRAGATDYVPKPFKRDILRDILRRLSRKSELRRETLHLEKKLGRKYAFEGLISRNPTMLELFGLIENIAKYFSCALITGETGTGKEVVARAIHGLSPHKDKP